MVTHDNTYQQFVVEGAEFQTFTDKWLEKVETYYKMNKQYYIGVQNVATTYTRIKNRRGLRADLPQPLADGEIGLAKGADD